MKTTDRFTSLEEVREERELLKARRDAHMGDLRAHWERFKDKEFRRALLVDAVSDALHPGSVMGAIAEGVKFSGGWLALLGPLIAGRKGLLGSRLFWSGLSFGLPLLVNSDGGSPLGEMWKLIGNGYRKAKRFMQKPAHVEADAE